jgi:hypothetical protein
MEPSSFAIWSMQKVIVVFSAAVWVTNIALMFEGEFHPSVLSVNPHKRYLISAALRVSGLFQFFDPLALSVCRLTLYGTL